MKTAVFVSAFLLICVLQSCNRAGTQGNETPAQTAPLFEQLTVFSAGEAGYHCFRIPALVVTAEGTILAFSEARKLTCHDDGGVSWSPVQFDQSLPEPSVQGSLVRLTDQERFLKNRVLLAHPSSQTERKQLTVRTSYDECQTWPVSKVLHEGSAAYSDLAIADDMTILCLYEADQYSKLALARFNLEWLTDGNDSLKRVNP